MLNRSVELWIGLVALSLSLAALFLWVPFDSETPPIYTFRRQTYIGDAMLPMVAAAGIAICAAIHVLLTLLRNDTKGDAHPFDTMTFVFFAIFGIICLASLVLLYWSGAAAVALFAQTGEETLTYRQMRGSVPWKYIGFVLGGFTMVYGTISLIEGRMSFRRILPSVLAVAILILVFDVPFDTILLPPNGDF